MGILLSKYKRIMSTFEVAIQIMDIKFEKDEETKV